MAEKKKRPTPAKRCVCNKCDAVAHAISGTNHRRCMGQKDEVPEGVLNHEQRLRDKRDKHPSTMRGTWA